MLRKSRLASWTGHSLPPGQRCRKEADQLPKVSFTPSTTCAVVLFRVSQVLSPTCRTVSNPARADVDRFGARRFAPVARADDFLLPRFDEALRADFFLADEAFDLVRFLLAITVSR